MTKARRRKQGLEAMPENKFGIVGAAGVHRTVPGARALLRCFQLYNAPTPPQPGLTVETHPSIMPHPHPPALVKLQSKTLGTAGIVKCIEALKQAVINDVH
ncbi:hypothetical protein CBL_13099 [Carabus blaptoides fortunei]